MQIQTQTTPDILSSSIPAARAEGLVVTEVGDEVLVYDQLRNHIHHLNRTSAVVWQLCDGQRAIRDLVRQARPELGAAVDENVIRLALEQLDKAGLLDRPLSLRIPVTTHTRRQVAKRLAAVGAGGLLAAVASISAAEASGPSCQAGASCTCNRDCSGYHCSLCCGGSCAAAGCDGNDCGH